MAPFSGFAPAAKAFLSALEENNSREWFKSHEADYRKLILEPSARFVVALAAVLRGASPTVLADPRVGGSLFRIQRDMRFSRGLGPYKTHIGMRLRDGPGDGSSRCAGPVYYVEFNALSLTLGVGVEAFDPAERDVYRARVLRDAAPFVAALQAAARAGHDVRGELLARPPSGCAGHPNEPLLRRKGLFVRSTTRHPGVMRSAAFVEHCASTLRPYAPLFNALCGVAQPR